MKRSPSALILPTIFLAFIILRLVYSKLTSILVFRIPPPNKLSTSPSSYHQTFHQPKHNSSILTPYTCANKTSVVIDSFGKPCLNITYYVKGQLIYAYRTPQLSYLYCAIPKNGCTYHLAIMHRLMGYSYEGGYAVHNEVNKHRIRPGEEIHQMLQHNIRRYIVVRNPIQRVLSAYLNKIERFYSDHSLKTPHTFREWIYKNIQPGMNWSGVNEHWRPQVDFCGFKLRDLSSYFTIFHVEKPEEYVAYLEDFLPDSVLRDGWDMPRNKSFRTHVLGPRTRTENTTDRFYEYMGNVSTFDYLCQAYSEDISALGYEEEIARMRSELVMRVSGK